MLHTLRFQRKPEMRWGYWKEHCEALGVEPDQWLIPVEYDETEGGVCFVDQNSQIYRDHGSWDADYFNTKNIKCCTL